MPLPDSRNAPSPNSESSNQLPRPGSGHIKPLAQRELTRESALTEAVGFSGPDDPALDPLLTGLALQLAMTARDESVRLGALHDLLTTRGHFARAQARAAVGAAAQLQALADPALVATLMQGLGQLGLVPPSTVSDLAQASSTRNVTPPSQSENEGVPQ